MTRTEFVYPDDVDHSIEIPEIYDGVAVWVLKDGRWINRFAGQEGWEHRARLVDEWIAQNREGGAS